MSEEMSEIEAQHWKSNYQEPPPAMAIQWPGAGTASKRILLPYMHLVYAAKIQSEIMIQYSCAIVTIVFGAEVKFGDFLMELQRCKVEEITSGEEFKVKVILIEGDEKIPF